HRADGGSGVFVDCCEGWTLTGIKSWCSVGHNILGERGGLEERVEGAVCARGSSADRGAGWYAGGDRCRKVRVTGAVGRHVHETEEGLALAVSARVRGRIGEEFDTEVSVGRAVQRAG